ncbi:MAG: hypothetical protein M1832_003772 [Thelocarpon impressellum]|nr:MAG: hypothetical protein M1832_003772 [Thelocarpon impressellum]
MRGAWALTCALLSSPLHVVALPTAGEPVAPHGSNFGAAGNTLGTESNANQNGRRDAPAPYLDSTAGTPTSIGVGVMPPIESPGAPSIPGSTRRVGLVGRAPQETVEDGGAAFPRVELPASSSIPYSAGRRGLVGRAPQAEVEAALEAPQPSGYYGENNRLVGRTPQAESAAELAAEMEGPQPSGYYSENGRP